MKRLGKEEMQEIAPSIGWTRYLEVHAQKKYKRMCILFDLSTNCILYSGLFIDLKRAR
jgi:hypothetical protein